MIGIAIAHMTGTATCNCNSTWPAWGMSCTLGAFNTIWRVRVGDVGCAGVEGWGETNDRCPICGSQLEVTLDGVTDMTVA